MVTYRFSVVKINKNNPLYKQNPFYHNQPYEILQFMGDGTTRTVGYAKNVALAKRQIRKHGKSKGIDVKFV